jgi:hypothetical protein
MPSLQQTTQLLFVVAIYIIATNFMCCYRTCLPPTMFRCILHLLPQTMIRCIFHLFPPTIIRCSFHLLPPTMIRCITFYCHQQINVAIVTLATKFVALRNFFNAMVHTAWQYSHIPT